MKKIRLIIVALICLMLLIWTGSASPEIKRTKITSDNSNFNVDVEVIGADAVEVNEKDASQSENIWSATNIKAQTNLDYNLFHIKAKNNGQTLRDVGSGGCTNSYDSHDEPYPYADVYLSPSSTTTTFYLNTEVRGEGASIIGICVFPNPIDTLGYDLTIAQDLIGKWIPKFNGNNNKFEFGRIHGYDKIFLDGQTDIEIGTANYQVSTDSSKILLHVYDPIVCHPDETCWTRPGTTIIPEFSTIAIPIAAILGFVFFFQHRKRKEE